MNTSPVLRIAWRVTIVIVFICSMLVLSQSLKIARAGGPWYVTTTGNDSNDCLSPASPCATINGAIGKAASGDTVYVATGTFTSSTGSEVVLIETSIKLSGGWDAAFTAQTGMTTIDGGAARNGITTHSGPIEIEKFVIYNGQAHHGSPPYGGGIYNDGTLTLTKCIVSGNQSSGGGAGIFNLGNLTVNNSTISNNSAPSSYGGGIESIGSLYLNDTIITNNSGIALEAYNGTITLNNVSVSSNPGLGMFLMSETANVNYSTFNGNTNGGIEILGSSGSTTLNNITVSNNSGYAGGILIRDGATPIINNSTISQNDNHGIFISGSSVTLNNSTVAGNTAPAGGGIINNGSTVTLRNSILAGNTASGPGPDCYGSISSAGYNLVGDTADCTITGDTTGNITGVDALLGPLQDNGGPTLTHALLPLSPAIDGGNPTGCTSGQGTPLAIDQRGKPRIGRCDIGAYELQMNVIYTAFLPYIHKPCSPIHFDDFSNPASGWPVGDDGKNRIEYLNGEYRMLVRPRQWGALVGPDFQAADYNVSVDLRNPGGVMGSYGIAFGIAGDMSSLYTLEIYPDGWYGIYRWDPSAIVVLSEAFSPAIIQGSATNHLKVERIGSSINAYANDQLLVSLTDGTYTGSRYLGLVVISYDQRNVDIRFDNFTVYSNTCPGPNASLSMKNEGSPFARQPIININSIERGHPMPQR